MSAQAAEKLFNFGVFSELLDVKVFQIAYSNFETSANKGGYCCDWASSYFRQNMNGGEVIFFENLGRDIYGNLRILLEV